MPDDAVTPRTVVAISSAAGLSFMGILVETSLNVTFPTLTAEFGVSLGVLQWLTTGYLLAVTLTMSTTAYLLTRLTPRSIFVVAASACIIGTLLCAMASNVPVIMVGRLLQAISTGLATPLMFHIIFEKIPLSRLGTYVGIASMVISFAPALGPTYGGVLTNALSWRLIFWCALVVVLVLLPLGLVSIRMPAKQFGSHFDAYGFVLLGIMLYGIVEAITRIGGRQTRSWAFAVIVSLTVIAIGLLARHAVVGTRQILNFRLLLHGVIGARALNYFIMQFTNIGISFVIPIFAQNTLHTNAMTAGLILLPGSLIGAFAAPMAGSFYDSHGPRPVLITADAGMFAGSALLCWLTPLLTPMLITVVYVLLRLGFNIGFGATMSDAVKHIDSSHNGEINALFNTLQQYAGSLGTGMLAAVITLQQTAANMSLAQSTATGARIDFLLLALLCLAALGVSMASTRRGSA